ncbi:MAG: hypothetical protein J2P41_12895 [Blastocatellia bacterium]|nr:hypothetical protein [Blastocatellia bacterium]
MRSIFEDSDMRAGLEEKETKKTGNNTVPFVLWLVAFAFIGVTFAVFRYVETRPALTPPPKPADLQDAKQTADTFSKFNKFVMEENWAEAANMLSTTALQRLKDQNKTLKESVLGDKKDMRVALAEPTASIDRAPDRVRQDCIYKFDDGQYIIVPLFLVIENNKLVIDAWSEA